MPKYPKCKCGHPRDKHEATPNGLHAPGECLTFDAASQQCPCPWYTPEDRSPQPARVGGSEA